MKYIVKTKHGFSHIVDPRDKVWIDEVGLHVEDSDDVITTYYAHAILSIIPTESIGKMILASASEAVDV